MAFLSFDDIRITAVSCAVPKNVVETESYKELFGSDEVNKFMQMTGVRQSRRTSKYQTVSDLGYAASMEIFRRKGISGSDVGALIFGSHSPDYRRPATALVLHKRLGLSREAVAYDISLGCSSLVFGIQTVASLLRTSDIKRALLIVGDTASKTVFPRDRASVMIFGEAGAAILIEKTDYQSDIKLLLRSDGNGYRYMIVPAGGYRNLYATNDVFVFKDGNERTLYSSYMMGTSVFTFTISDVPNLIKDFWRITSTTVDDYDCYAFHQANEFILKQIAKKTGIPTDKMPLTLAKYANTSGASAAVSICDRYGNENGLKVKTIICGFGIGLSWGICSAEIDSENIYPIIEDDQVFEEGVINSPDQLS